MVDKGKKAHLHLILFNVKNGFIYSFLCNSWIYNNLYVVEVPLYRDKAFTIIPHQVVKLTLITGHEQYLPGVIINTL